MKIAITGHTAGIGQALAKQYAQRGHEIVGLSKREGNNIHNVAKICDLIEPCDVFVNNAQSNYAQTELMFEMARRWTGSFKHIVVISTQLTQYPVSLLPGLDMDHYRVQKVALEESVRQLRQRYLGIRFTVVRPGNVATGHDQTPAGEVNKWVPAAEVNNWAQTLISIFELSEKNNLWVSDITLGT